MQSQMTFSGDDPKKTLLLIDCTPVPIVILWSLGQLAKALSPIVVTEFDILMEVRLVHPLNKEDPIWVTVLPMVTFFNVSA